ncbi:hypothetical protein GCM10009837_72880 [Streptomyces durmitorensis]
MPAEASPSQMTEASAGAAVSRTREEAAAVRGPVRLRMRGLLASGGRGSRGCVPSVRRAEGKRFLAWSWLNTQ